jgi:uncharacterized membrane protein
VKDARIDVQEAAASPDFSLTVKRNCSISPQALAWLLAFVAIVSFGIGIAFALFGAWLVLPFVGLEIAALAAAFYINGRHATDLERISLNGGTLTVEIVDRERRAEHRFNAHWVRLVLDRVSGDPRVLLRSHGNVLEIGRHLDGPGRELLATELRARLADLRAAR